jgi:signal transduction histidine kinase
MCHQDKSKEQLVAALRQLELEIRELKDTEDNQKKNIETLYLERELYTDLANALPSGIYRLRVFKEVSLIENKWLDSKDIPYAFEFANDRFFEILHAERSVFEKNPGMLHDLIFEADKAEFARINVESNLHTIPFLWEGRFLINGKVIWAHFKSIPRLMDNGDIIWTGILEDITRRKQTEEEIKFKNAELQKLNADKDVFMSILAHDLISPFNSILGYLNLLASNLRDYEMDIIENQITLIHKSALNTFGLLEDILMWGRSQSGKLSFKPGAIDFKTSCDKVVEILKPNANNKNITIFTETEKVVVFADVNMLHTVLRNLISNAIKFTNSYGNIRIDAKRNNSEVIVSVVDNGIGIAPEMLSKLFDITQMNSTKGTANEGGTGLGLLLCREFVERHGGQIWVDSEWGKGSEFKFTLPLNPELSGFG